MSRADENEQKNVARPRVPSFQVFLKTSQVKSSQDLTLGGAWKNTGHKYSIPEGELKPEVNDIFVARLCRCKPHSRCAPLCAVGARPERFDE